MCIGWTNKRLGNFCTFTGNAADTMFHLKLIPFLSDSHSRTDRCEFEDFSNALTTQDAFYLLRNAIHIGDKQEPTDLKSRSGRLISTQVLHIEWKKTVVGTHLSKYPVPDFIRFIKKFLALLACGSRSVT